MRSRTSREVPEWSGGEELYIGSQVSATGKVSGVTGIVPGPPEGSRGSTGWATYPGGPRGLKVEGNQPLVGWGAPLGPPPMRLGLGTLGGELPPCLGGQGTPFHPLAAAPPTLDGFGRPPSQGGRYKGGEGGQQATALGASLLPCNTSLSLSQKLGEALPETRYVHHHAVVLLDLHQPLLPPCWIKKEETSLLRTCVERGGAVRSALGHR